VKKLRDMCKSGVRNLEGEIIWDESEGRNAGGSIS
jgi:hypothetical protein